MYGRKSTKNKYVLVPYVSKDYENPYFFILSQYQAEMLLLPF